MGLLARLFGCLFGSRSSKNNQIVMDPQTATAFIASLVDPRAIKSILVVATSEEPRISGFSYQNFAASMFASVNPTLYSVLKDVGLPDMGVCIRNGDLAEVAMDSASHAADELESSGRRVISHIQFRTTTGYPSGYGGPRRFALITFAMDDRPGEGELRLNDDPSIQLLPEYDSRGRRLVELRPT